MTTPNRYLSVPRYRVALVASPKGRPGWLATFFTLDDAEGYVADVATRMHLAQQPGALTVEKLEPVS